MRESRRRLGTLLGNLPGMAYRCRNDRQRTMDVVSEGCLGCTGFPAVDLQGNRVVSYASLIHPDDQATLWQATQAAVRDRAALPAHVPHRHRRRGYALGVGTGGAIGAAADGPKMLEGFIADITDRRAAEEDLRRRAPGCSTSSKRSMTCWWSTTPTGYVDVIAGDDSPCCGRPRICLAGR